MRTINEFKETLKGLPKEDKICIIKQELSNRGFAATSRPGETKFSMSSSPKLSYAVSNNELEELKTEIENNPEAYKSLTARKELIPFMYDRDLNWYFNAKNIPAQEKLVTPTYEFFNEGHGKNVFDPLDFLNLLFKQKNDLLLNLNKPIDTLNNIKSIPINETERHTLLGFILKWFGGYPVNNLNDQVNTILKLIEKEFLLYPEQTFEKEFCLSDYKSDRKFAEIGAHLSAEMKGVTIITPNNSVVTHNYNFPGSHYIKKVEIDFEDLPHYIIQKAIIFKFEGQQIIKDSEFFGWQQKLSEFLQTIPQEYVIKALSKGIEYGQIVYKYHVANECNNVSNCELNQSWERRLALARNLLTEILPNEEKHKQEKGKKVFTNTCFIIHGHNNHWKHEVSRFIDKDLQKSSTILHEMPNKGRTIIEKFENHSVVDFAVALWTADDVGRSILDTTLHNRARQNVLFETGFFIGKLGRENVIVMHEDGVELPSDYSGVIYLSFSNNWKDDLRKEISAIYL